MMDVRQHHHHWLYVGHIYRSCLDTPEGEPRPVGVPLLYREILPSWPPASRTSAFRRSGIVSRPGPAAFRSRFTFLWAPSHQESYQS